jgi:hypothetical protein
MQTGRGEYLVQLPYFDDGCGYEPWRVSIGVITVEPNAMYQQVSRMLELKHDKAGVSVGGSGGTGVPPSKPPSYATHDGRILSLNGHLSLPYSGLRPVRRGLHRSHNFRRSGGSLWPKPSFSYVLVRPPASYLDLREQPQRSCLLLHLMGFT